MIFARTFAMPNAQTFTVAPIKNFVHRYIQHPSIDPFARNNTLASYTNDLDPNTTAQQHLDAEEFLCKLHHLKFFFAVGLFDPPYSPRQISEMYKSIGLPVRTADTQNAALYKAARDALDPLIMPGGVVLSFGWNSMGMGVKRNYELVEILLVAHGGAHNDTICLAERKLQ